MLTLNIFPSAPPSTDEYELQNQRISTRLFIIIFFILLAVILLYTSLIRVAKTISVEKPTFMEYINLNSTYSQTLTCPCSKISINYGKFLYVNYTLHQVCSSIFVDREWIKILGYSTTTEFFRENFRWTGTYAFQALRGFCVLINQTISNRSIEFNSNQYISASIVPKALLESEIKSVMDQFRSSLTNNFLLFLRTVQDITHANALFSALQNNYFVVVANLGQNGIITSNESYNDCNCVTSSACIAPSFISIDPDSSSSFHITNFYRGCSVIQALLQSTLECFYDQQCIDDLQDQLSWSMPVTALNKSLPSIYLINSTIKELLDNLMIEQWNVSSIFEHYYNECQPIKCIHTFETNNGIIYIVTTLFGIVGGLVTVLKFIVPWSVKLVRKRRGRQQQQPITGKFKLMISLTLFDLLPGYESPS